MIRHDTTVIPFPRSSMDPEKFGGEGEEEEEEEEEKEGGWISCTI